MIKALFSVLFIPKIIAYRTQLPCLQKMSDSNGKCNLVKTVIRYKLSFGITIVENIWQGIFSSCSKIEGN